MHKIFYSVLYEEDLSYCWNKTTVSTEQTSKGGGEEYQETVWVFPAGSVKKTYAVYRDYTGLLQPPITWILVSKLLRDLITHVQ